MTVALGMGENTRATLITRALAEMTRFAVKLGANPMTFLGLAGVGDLLVTCSSPKSRNYQVGYAIGQGLSLEEAVSRLGEVAEGVNTLKVLKAKSDELGIYMPLVTGLYAIIFGGMSLEKVIEKLMLAEPKTDVDFISTEGFKIKGLINPFILIQTYRRLDKQEKTHEMLIVYCPIRYS